MPRRIIANLDCDVEYARRVAAERLYRRGAKESGGLKRRLALPVAVADAISAMATLLRAFARDGDRLWTPNPVDDVRLAEAPGLPRVELESGPLDVLPPAAHVLAWGSTGLVERERGRATSGPAQSLDEPPATLAEALWECPAVPASIAAAANHRGFALNLASSLGVALPGAKLVRSLEELEAHLFYAGAAAAPGERWVLKTPHSAAGRSRILGTGRSLAETTIERAARLLALHGALVFEPWMDRTADFGCLGLVTDGEPRPLGAHKLEVDRQGTQDRPLVLHEKGTSLSVFLGQSRLTQRSLANPKCGSPQGRYLSKSSCTLG